MMGQAVKLGSHEWILMGLAVKLGSLELILMGQAVKHAENDERDVLTCENACTSAFHAVCICKSRERTGLHLQIT